MSQHDFTISNATFPAVRADLNNALAAIASTSSGTTAPTTTRAGQLWYDTSEHKLKVRNEADSGWITLLSVTVATGRIELGDAQSRPPAPAPTPAPAPAPTPAPTPAPAPAPTPAPAGKQVK